MIHVRALVVATASVVFGCGGDHDDGMEDNASGTGAVGGTGWDGGDWPRPTGNSTYEPPAPPVVTSVSVALSSFTTNASAFDGDADDTHAVSDWQVDEASGDFSSPLLSSNDDSISLTNKTFNRSSLTDDGAYKIRVRYRGAQGGDSPWSNAFSFTNTCSTGCDGAGGSSFGANEPAGFTPITDNDFTSYPGSGWWSHSEYYHTLESGPTPGGDNSFVRHTYPAGWQWDQGPSLIGYDFTAQAAPAAYVCLRVRVSENYQWAGNGNNKLGNRFVPVAGGNRFILSAGENGEAIGGTYKWRATGIDEVSDYELPHNLGTKRSNVGEWVEIEMVYRQQSAGGVADGEFYMWIDGTQVAQHTDVMWFPLPEADRRWAGIVWDPNRGNGGGEPYLPDLTEPDWADWDRVYVSVGN